MFWFWKSINCIWSCYTNFLWLIVNMFSYTLCNVLFNSGFKVPRGLTNITDWATAFKRVNDTTFMFVRYEVFIFRTQNRSWCKNNFRFSRLTCSFMFVSINSVLLTDSIHLTFKIKETKSRNNRRICFLY